MMYVDIRHCPHGPLYFRSLIYMECFSEQMEVQKCKKLPHTIPTAPCSAIHLYSNSNCKNVT